MTQVISKNDPTPFELFQSYQISVNNWIEGKDNSKETLTNAINSITKFIPWLLSQQYPPPGLDLLALADSILSIQQSNEHIKLVLPLLELSLNTNIQKNDGDNSSLKNICKDNILFYRRTCQDIYALLIWLNHQIGDEITSKKYLDEYNSYLTNKLLKFEDTSLTHRQLPNILAKPWWNEEEVKHQFIKNIQKNYLTIKNEILSIINSNIWGPYLDVRLSTNSNWDPKTSWDSIPLYGNNEWNNEHCNILPLTCSLLKEHEIEFKKIFNRSNYLNLIGQERIEQDYTEIPTLGIKIYKVWKDSRIKPHMGSPGRLVHSIGISTPINPFSTVTVGNITKDWIEGQFHHFDDSFVHDVINSHPTDSRIVLAFVAIHPNLLYPNHLIEENQNIHINRFENENERNNNNHHGNDL